MKNKKTLEIGKSDFKKIVENNHYFVDKTKLIYDFLNSKAYISLMPRPKVINLPNMSIPNNPS